jgi:hypothetical protein
MATMTGDFYCCDDEATSLMGLLRLPPERVNQGSWRFIKTDTSPLASF